MYFASGVQDLQKHLCADRQRYERLLAAGIPSTLALKMLNMKCVPETGEERLARINEIWDRCGMRTRGDYLVLYNKVDVLACMQLIKAFAEQHAHMGSDMFEYVSISSLAWPTINRALAKFSTRNFFARLSREAYVFCRRGRLGGFAQAFNRVFIENYTRLEEHRYGPTESLLCKRVYSFDLNFLYVCAHLLLDTHVCADMLAVLVN